MSGHGRWRPARASGRWSPPSRRAAGRRSPPGRRPAPAARAGAPSGSAKGRPCAQAAPGPARSAATSRPRRRTARPPACPRWRATSKDRLCTRPAQQPGHHDQVARAADGQELAQPLQDPERQRLEWRQRSAPKLTLTSCPLLRVSVLHGLLRLRERGGRRRPKRPASPSSTTASPSATASTRRCAPTAAGPSTWTATCGACARSADRLGIAIPLGDAVFAALARRPARARRQPGVLHPLHRHPRAWATSPIASSACRGRPS